MNIKEIKPNMILHDIEENVDILVESVNVDEQKCRVKINARCSLNDKPYKIDAPYDAYYGDDDIEKIGLIEIGLQRVEDIIKWTTKKLLLS